MQLRAFFALNITKTDKILWTLNVPSNHKGFFRYTFDRYSEYIGESSNFVQNMNIAYCEISRIFHLLVEIQKADNWRNHMQSVVGLGVYWL